MRYISTLSVAFLVLVGLFVLLLTAAQRSWEQPQQSPLYTDTQVLTFYGTSSSALPSFLASLRSGANERSEKAVLDNDQDHDGNYDGINDPLVALGLVLVVLSMGFVVHALASGRLLLVFCEQPKLSSIWSQALQRPG
jgi:hypothetical protein